MARGNKLAAKGFGVQRESVQRSLSWRDRIPRHTCGYSSVGRAQPSHGWGHEFESRYPLSILNPIIMKTEINVFRNGKVVFHSIEPYAMTVPQVHAELKKWHHVNTDNAYVQVIYHDK